MIITRMIRDDIHNDLDADFLECGCHFVEILQCPNLGIYIAVIRHVVYTQSAITKCSSPSEQQRHSQPPSLSADG